MAPRRASATGKTAAVLILAALVVVLLGSTGGFAADPDSPGEACVGCAGCDSGNCGDDDDPLTPHHHCCTTSCLSHAPFALPGAQPALAPASVAAMASLPAVAPSRRSPKTHYRPPRI
jgi:hypothetical protein